MVDFEYINLIGQHRLAAYGAARAVYGSSPYIIIMQEEKQRRERKNSWST